MIGKSPNPSELGLFRPRLLSFIDPNHKLVSLTDKIDWSFFKQAFGTQYSSKGRKAVPIRSMVGCLLLKHIRKESG